MAQGSNEEEKGMKMDAKLDVCVSFFMQNGFVMSGH